VEFVPETRPGASEPGAFSGEADVLARKTAGDDVNRNTVGGKAGSRNVTDVAINRNAGEVLAQHSLTERFVVAHGGDVESCALETKLKSSDTAEQAEHVHSGHTIRRPRQRSNSARHSSIGGNT
jgi:hypothetical protein